MSGGISASDAFLASSNRQGFTEICTTLMPSFRAFSIVPSVEPVSAISK